MARATKKDDLLAELNEGIEDAVVTEVEVADAIEGAAAVVGSTRQVPAVEYVIERNGKTMTPVRYLPKSLWDSVAPIDETIAAVIESAEVDGKSNIVEDLLMTTGQRSFERLMALMPPTNPQGKGGFDVKKETAARSYVMVFEGTDPAVPMSGTMKVVSMLDVSTPAGDKERVTVPSHYLKNRVLVSEDGKLMTVICGARTSVSWGNDRESQVYLNVGSAAQTPKRSIAQLRGRAREVLQVAKHLSWVHCMSAEHEGSLKREAHLLATVELKNVYYGRPRGSAETAKSGLQGSIALVADANFMLGGERRINDKTVWTGTHFHIG